MTATVSTPHFSRQIYLHAREGRGRNRQSEDYPRCADAADKKKRKKNSLSALNVSKLLAYYFYG